MEYCSNAPPWINQIFIESSKFEFILKRAIAISSLIKQYCGLKNGFQYFLFDQYYNIPDFEFSFTLITYWTWIRINTAVLVVKMRNTFKLQATVVLSTLL